jgi:Fic family protein
VQIANLAIFDIIGYENSAETLFSTLRRWMCPSLPRFPARKYRRAVIQSLCKPLPPELNWTPRLIGALSDADRLVGRLAGAGGRLPDPHLLIRPFLQREAVLSSKIEGTQVTLGELLAAEAGAIVDRSPEDLREVGNYVVALEHGISRLKKLPLCIRLARELHEKLMTGVQGLQAAPGRFRKIQNWIGKPGGTIATASDIPPPPEGVEPCLAAGKSSCMSRHWRRS